MTYRESTFTATAEQWWEIWQDTFRTMSRASTVLLIDQWGSDEIRHETANLAPGAVKAVTIPTDSKAAGYARNHGAAETPGEQRTFTFDTPHNIDIR